MKICRCFKATHSVKPNTPINVTKQDYYAKLCHILDLATHHVY